MNRVIQQARGVMLDAGLAPASRRYNASIAEHDGSLWMAYRHNPTGGGACRIRMAELDRNLKVLRDEAVLVPEMDGGDNLEDPRLFSFRGGLWIAWTAAWYGPHGWTCRQQYGQLTRTRGGWSVRDAFAPQLGNNTGKAKEKNWQFFESGGRLLCQYEPHHVVEIEGNTAGQHWRVPRLPWRYGKPSGGTPPVPFSPGKLITFFHAYEPDEIYQRRYNFAALVFEDKPPFRHVSVSSFPLVVASEFDTIPDGRWTPLCVFPCGAIRESSGEWLVSLGVNDIEIALVRFRDDELHLSDPRGRMVLHGETVRVRLLKSIVYGGDIVSPPAVVQLPRRTAQELLARRAIIPLPQVTP